MQGRWVPTCNFFAGQDHGTSRILHNLEGGQKSRIYQPLPQWSNRRTYGTRVFQKRQGPKWGPEGRCHVTTAGMPPSPGGWLTLGASNANGHFRPRHQWHRGMHLVSITPLQPRPPPRGRGSNVPQLPSPPACTSCPSHPTTRGGGDHP